MAEFDLLESLKSSSKLIVEEMILHLRDDIEKHKDAINEDEYMIERLNNFYKYLSKEKL